MNFLKNIKSKDTILVFFIGLIIFGALNMLMLQMNYDLWTSLKFGAYTAFHKGWELSGFDNTTYIAVATGRPLYIMMRHPLIMYFVWPLWQVHDMLQESLKMNCSIHIVACVWTIISTISWTLMYRIMRKIIELPVMISLLLCLFYFSFSHVMLASFAPDHMILSMTLLLFMLYISAKAAKKDKQTSTWKSLLMCGLATGVSTTNCVKIWLIDTCSMQGGIKLKEYGWWKRFISHGLCYLIPLAFVGGLYYYDMQSSFAEEEQYADKMHERMKKRNPKLAAEREARHEKVEKENESKQLVDSKLFQWTDFSLPIGPSIVENFFGEGLQLHDKYTLRDSHREGHRPDIVTYSHWYNYLVETVIVLLMAIGTWLGRKERLMWMVLSVFLFDCLIHLGLRFALNDVYIMTAHWAFIIPIAVGYTYRSLRNNRNVQAALVSVVTLLTVWLWYHNLSLTYDFILNAFKV